MKKIILLSIYVFFNYSALTQEKTQFTYLFVAHTYMGEQRIDYRLEELNKSNYDNIWLGGDICSETLLYQSTLEYLQAHLRIRDPHNYFSLGNHDRRNGNLEYFENFIGKKAYYADYYNGFSAIVLDTNLDPSDCENLNNQYKIICNVTDTISQSSHLLLFFHWGLWTDIPGLPDPSVYAHTSLKYWNSNCDSANNNFAKTIYPKLVDVQNRGVQVICIMGDMGASYKKFDRLSNEGIRFLGCGLDNIKYLNEPDKWYAKEKDLILEFYHNTETKSLTWTFRDLDSLLDVQNGYKYLLKQTFDNQNQFPETQLVYIQHENYVYPLAPNDSLEIFYENLPTNTPDTIRFEGVYKSIIDIGNLNIVFYLYENDNLIDTKNKQYSNKF